MFFDQVSTIFESRTLERGFQLHESFAFSTFKSHPPYCPVTTIDGETKTKPLVYIRSGYDRTSLLKSSTISRKLYLSAKVSQSFSKRVVYNSEGIAFICQSPPKAFHLGFQKCATGKPAGWLEKA